jgi:hypothetical protein
VSELVPSLWLCVADAAELGQDAGINEFCPVELLFWSRKRDRFAGGDEARNTVLCSASLINFSEVRMYVRCRVQECEPVRRIWEV